MMNAFLDADEMSWERLKYNSNNRWPALIWTGLASLDITHRDDNHSSGLVQHSRAPLVVGLESRNAGRS